MPTLEQYQAWLAQAQQAYHALMTGTAAVRMRDQNGEEIQYSRSSASQLLAYIRCLQGEINKLMGTYDPCADAPMRIFIG